LNNTFLDNTLIFQVNSNTNTVLKLI
jgi:hypothetical protein